jgi:hypothetical protein
MADDPEQPPTQMPWPLRIWPLAIMAIAVTAALVLLAVLIDSDVTRVALPAITSAIGTIALAVVTVRLSIGERAHQDQLRRADESARRREAEHEQEIKEVRERVASEREKQLELAAAVRQARRVVAVRGPELPGGDTEAVMLVNGSDYPIFEVTLIGARIEDEVGEPASDREWPPELRLGGGQGYVAVLLPGERHVCRGYWQWRRGFALRGNTIKKQRSSYTWTDDQGRAWLRDGSQPPKLLARPWTFGDFMESLAEYSDGPAIQP